jgi:hypothetical protein
VHQSEQLSKQRRGAGSEHRDQTRGTLRPPTCASKMLWECSVRSECASVGSAPKAQMLIRRSSEPDTRCVPAGFQWIVFTQLEGYRVSGSCHAAWFRGGGGRSMQGGREAVSTRSTDGSLLRLLSKSSARTRRDRGGCARASACASRPGAPAVTAGLPCLELWSAGRCSCVDPCAT